MPYEPYINPDTVPPTKADLIADIQAVQQLYTTVLITRNFYRIHGKYTEAQWHYFFPTFKEFLLAANLNAAHDQPDPIPATSQNQYFDYSSCSNLSLQTEIAPVLNLANSRTGDIFAMGPKLYQVTGRKDTAVYVKRYYWYHRLSDHIRKLCDK